MYGIPASAGLRFLRPIALDYTRLGIEHILTGFDHLMFVLAITILVQSRKKLIAAISAFTVAHSLTLAATVLGWLSLPSAAVETTIALSIVLACSRVPATDRLAGAARAVAGDVRVRPVARHGLRVRAARDGLARKARALGALVLQRRRGARPTRSHRAVRWPSAGSSPASNDAPSGPPARSCTRWAVLRPIGRWSGASRCSAGDDYLIVTSPASSEIW